MYLAQVKFILLVCLLAITEVNCRRLPALEYEDGWPHLTLYQHENHQGKQYHQEVGPRCYNLPKIFDDEASSLKTHHRCVQVCSERDCKKCIKMNAGGPGHYALREIRLNDDISSFTQC